MARSVEELRRESEQSRAHSSIRERADMSELRYPHLHAVDDDLGAVAVDADEAEFAGGQHAKLCLAPKRLFALGRSTNYFFSFKSVSLKVLTMAAMSPSWVS